VIGLPGADRGAIARGTRSTFEVGGKSYAYFSLANILSEERRIGTPQSEPR